MDKPRQRTSSSLGKDLPPLAKAHACANRAEEARSNRKYEEAIELHHQAAELFLLATNSTAEVESIKALQILSAAQNNKANELQKQLQMFNEQQKLNNKYPSPPSNARVTFGSSPPATIIPSPATTTTPPATIIPTMNTTTTTTTTGTNISSTNMNMGLSGTDAMLYGSQNYFVGQTPADSGSMNEILLFYPPKLQKATDSIATIPVDPADLPSRNSSSSDPQFEIPLNDKEREDTRFPILADMMNLDMWGWMEKMLEILPKPIANMTSLTTQRRQEDSSHALHDSNLMSSFYFVPTLGSNPSQQPPSSLRTSPHSQPHATVAITIPHSVPPVASSPPTSDLKMKQLEEENRQLKEIVQKLQVENASLKNVCERGAQVSKENDMMKKSIVLFRQEFQKKAKELRQHGGGWSSPHSNSVGNLSHLLSNLNTTSPNMNMTASSSALPTRFTDESIDKSNNNNNNESDNNVRELESRVQTLSSQLREMSEKCNKQSRLIEKYEQRWENLKEEARRRRRPEQRNESDILGSSPPSVNLSTSRSGGVADSMTSEVNLSMLEREEQTNSINIPTSLGMAKSTPNLQDRK